MYYDKQYFVSDYLSYQDMNDLVDKVENLVGEMSIGKNLCDIEGVVKSTAYCTYTYNNGVFTMTPTQTSRYARLQFIIPKSLFTENEKYTISATGPNKYAIGYANSVGDTSHFDYFGTANNVSKLSFTYETIPTDYVCFYLYNSNQVLGTNWTISNIQLEKGSATSYEPYIQILPPSHYDLDLPTYELNDFVFVEDMNKIERNIMNIGYDFFQPPGYIQNKIWSASPTGIYANSFNSFGADDLNRMITDMNILYSHKDERPTIYNLFTNENWDGETTLEWE